MLIDATEVAEIHEHEAMEAVRGLYHDCINDANEGFVFTSETKMDANNALHRIAQECCHIMNDSCLRSIHNLCEEILYDRETTAR